MTASDMYPIDLKFGDLTGTIVIENLKAMNDKVQLLVTAFATAPKKKLAEFLAQHIEKPAFTDDPDWLTQLKADLDHSLANPTHNIKFYHIRYGHDVQIGLQLRLAEAIAMNPFDFYCQVMMAPSKVMNSAGKLENPLGWPDPYGAAPDLWNRLQTNMLNDVKTIREIHFAKAPHSGSGAHIAGAGAMPVPVCSHASLSFISVSAEDHTPFTLLDFRLAQTAHT